MGGLRHGCPFPRGKEDDRVANLPAADAGGPRADRSTSSRRFVTACDTTDPAHPDGDWPPRPLSLRGWCCPTTRSEPAAWSTEDRATTVALDPPGQPVAERGDTVAVIVTGTMTVTSDSGPPQLVPLAERIALRPLNDDHSAGDHSISDRGVSGWQVVDVEVGA